MSRIERLVGKWKTPGILDSWPSLPPAKCPEGASPEAIAEFETQYGVAIPDDLRAYFLAVNGMGPAQCVFDDAFNSFWQIENVVSVADYEPDGSCDVPESNSWFIFADHSLHIETFAIRLSSDSRNPSPVARVRLCENEQFDIEVAFDSFSAFLDAYLDNPMGIL